MKRLFLAGILALGFAGPALANHCPSDIRTIDAALRGNPDSEAKALRDEGAELHADGKHAESLEKLHEAMTILGIEH